MRRFTIFITLLLGAIVALTPSALNAQVKQPDKMVFPTTEVEFRYHAVPGDRAESFAKLMRELFADAPVTIVALPPDRIAVWADAKTQAHISLMFTVQLPRGEAAVIQLKVLRASTMEWILKSTFAKADDLFIEADLERNAIRVRGTKEQVSEVREEIARIEKSVTMGKKEKNLELRFYDVPNGTPEKLVETLQLIFPKVKIQPISPTRLFVYADPQTHSYIRVVIDVLMPPNMRPNPRVTEIIRVKNLDAQGLADSLNKVFLNMDTRSGSSITANKERNALVVRGTPDEIKEVKMVLEVYDALTIDMGPKKEPPKLPPNVRVLHIDDGHADTVGEAMRKIFPIMYADEKGRPQITIVAVADTVVVVSEDAKALDQAVEIARLLIRSEVPQCDYEVIALKHAKAADIVRIVDEIYNSKKNEKGERMERVRVVVDMQTNAMLLRGRELDRAAIRNFVTRTLDVPPEKK